MATRASTPTRRGPSEGSVYEQSGKWVAVVQVGYEEGKRKREYRRFATKTEARDYVRERVSAIRRGEPSPPARLTLETYLRAWLATDVIGHVSDRTYESYESTVRLHILPTLGRLRVAKLTAEDVQRTLNALSPSLSPRSVAYVRTVLWMALELGRKRGCLARNVVESTHPPKAEHHEIDPLSPDEARQLIAHAEPERLRALLTVTLALGLRKGEVLGVRWSDIDFESGTLRVTGAIVPVPPSRRLLDSERLQRREPKTPQSRRALVLPGVALAALREQRRRQAEERLLAGSLWRDNDLVFSTPTGTPLDPRNVTRQFERALSTAGIRHVRFHDLRHSTATLLHSAGVSVRTIQAILGHSRASTTLNIYTHVLPSLREDAAIGINAVLAAGAR